MDKIKQQFLEENKFNDSIEKSYKMIFKKMRMAEVQVEKDFKDFTYEEILNFLPYIKSTSYQSINLKWTLARKYLDYFGNQEGQKITQGDLKKHINDAFAKYITREDLLKGVDSLINAQDQAIIMLLFEGIMGKGYHSLSTVKTKDIDFENNTITVGDRVFSINKDSMDIFRAASRQDTYEKLGEGGSGDSRYDFNMNSPYLIKGKPSKRNDNGLDYIKENGIKPRIVKLIKEMELENLTGLSIYHSGLLEKLQAYQNECGKTLTQTDVVAYLTKLGVEKFEPNTFVRALKAMGK